MGSCNCGGKTVKFTPGKVKQATISAAPAPAKNPSARSRRLSAQARKKALNNSAPCDCKP